MPDGAPPRVFISYSHDDAAHEARVLALANRLRADSIDVTIDQDHVSFPPGGWARWSEAQVRTADFVVMVCSEAYRQRFEDEAPPDVGRGVVWEAAAIRELLYDARAASRKFVPVMFSGGKREHVPAPLRGGYINRIETDDGHKRLHSHLTGEPYVQRPDALQAQPPATATPASPPPSAASEPHPRVEDIFVGRRAEREQLAAVLFPAGGRRRPVVVSGMAGVGKSYLVDRFYWENMARFPGGYVRLALDPANPGSAAELLATLRDRLKLPAGDGGALAARLAMPLTLVHIENADTFAAGRVVGEFCTALLGCAIVASARYQDLGFAAGWPEVPLAPFDAADSSRHLAAELGPDASGQADWPALAAALGHLPLALHLAAGYLRRGASAEAFLQRLISRKLALTGAHPNDPTFLQRSYELLSDTFSRSLDALRREGGANGDPWLAGFAAFGHLPASGFGAGLGAAVADLAPEIFAEMIEAAAGLSLIDRVPRGAGTAYRLHPLLAELVRPRVDAEAAFARMTEWFVVRLPEGGDDQGRRWREVGDEIAALSEWLAQVPSADRVRVERAGSRYAIGNGPFHAWLRFCEEALTDESGEQARSNFLWTLGNVALSGGLPDRALAAAEEKARIDRDRGADREAALAASLRADTLEARGQLDEALKIRQNDELPVYERLGDVRSRAVTMGQIADILQARGQLDEALKIRHEEQLPVYQRLGDVRERAVTMGQIADILQARGQLDEALKIRHEEQLPVYQRLGDVRERAVTMGQIADILQARGQLDEALKIRQDDELPVYERLGDVRSRAVTMGRIADILQARGQLDEALKIRQGDVLPAFERLGDPRLVAVEKGKIADILQARGQLDEALKIRNEEQLPVYQRLGDVRERAVTMGQIADILQARGQLDEALKILREEVLPAMERLGDVRERAVTMGQIADILQARGQLDEALKIRHEEQLPVYQRLGDVRERAVTMGQIADILQARGQLDEALKIRQDDELPVYERLGDVRELLVGRANLAMTLLTRGHAEDRNEAGRLLYLALDAARRLKLPEAQQIEQIIERAGLGGDEIAALRSQ